MDDFVEEVIEVYDEYIREKEGRGISYGEIAYIDGLKKKELNNLYEEICEWKEKNEDSNRH